MSGSGIDAMLSEYPQYERAVIPGGTYSSNPADVRTFGVRAVVVTTTRMSDTVAYEITKAVFDNFDDFRRLHPPSKHCRSQTWSMPLVAPPSTRERRASAVAA